MQLTDDRRKDLLRNTIMDHYFIKPQIVQSSVLSGHLPFNKNLNGYCMYLFYEEFEEAVFAYKHNPFYHEKKRQIENHLRKSYILCESSIQIKNYRSADIEAIYARQRELKEAILFMESTYNPESYTEWTTKYFNYWSRTTFTERKRLIKKCFPKSKYREFNYLLTNANQYLRLLSEYSFKNCRCDRPLQLYSQFGQSLDWLFLLLTETDLKKHSEFLKLFQANVRLKNDLVAVNGAINILKEEKALEQCFFGDFNRADPYVALFAEVLESGREVARLFTKVEDQEEVIESIEPPQTRAYDELDSMHRIGVDHKELHDVCLKPFMEEIEKERPRK